MPLKQFKITVDFLLDIDDITDETIEQNLEGFPNSEELKSDTQYLEDCKRSKRLLEALLENEVILRKFVRRTFANHAATDAETLIEEYMNEPGDYESSVQAIKPILNSLNQGDKEYFQNAIEKELLYEHSDNFYEAFSLSLNKIGISEIK